MLLQCEYSVLDMAQVMLSISPTQILHSCVSKENIFGIKVAFNIYLIKKKISSLSLVVSLQLLYTCTRHTDLSAVNRSTVASIAMIVCVSIVVMLAITPMAVRACVLGLVAISWCLMCLVAVGRGLMCLVAISWCFMCLVAVDRCSVPGSGVGRDSLNDGSGCVVVDMLEHLSVVLWLDGSTTVNQSLALRVNHRSQLVHLLLRDPDRLSVHMPDNSLSAGWISRRALIDKELQIFNTMSNREEEDIVAFGDLSGFGSAIDVWQLIKMVANILLRLNIKEEHA